MFDILHQLGCKLIDGQNCVCQPGGDGRAGHALVLRLLRVLNHQQAALFLNGLDADRPIGAAARQDNGNGVAMARARLRKKKSMGVR